jgi:hypothetical protein
MRSAKAVCLAGLAILAFPAIVAYGIVAGLLEAIRER